MQCVDDYLEGYLTVSHPRSILLVEHGDDVEPSHVGGPSDDMLPSSHGVDDQQRLQMIIITMDNLVSLINSDGGFIIWHHKLHIARGESM